MERLELGIRWGRVSFRVRFRAEKNWLFDRAVCEATQQNLLFLVI